MPLEIDGKTGKPVCYSEGNDEACANFGVRCPVDLPNGCFLRQPVVGKRRMRYVDTFPGEQRMEGGRVQR